MTRRRLLAATLLVAAAMLGAGGIAFVPPILLAMRRAEALDALRAREPERRLEVLRGPAELLTGPETFRHLVTEELRYPGDDAKIVLHLCYEAAIDQTVAIVVRGAGGGPPAEVSPALIETAVIDALAAAGDLMSRDVKKLGRILGAVTPSAAERLEALIDRLEPWTRRARAIWALGAIEGESGRAALRRIARTDLHHGPRVQAIRKLGESPGPDDVATLIAVLQSDPHEQPRGLTIGALVEAGAENAAPALIEALAWADEHDHPILVSNAAHALARLTGQDRFGDDPVRWRAWLAEQTDAAKGDED